VSVIDVVVSEIRAHADRVEDVGANVDTARSAAGQVSMTAEAYGRLCGPQLAPVLGSLEAAGIAGIGSCGFALEATATALRTMANSLEVVDQIASDYTREAGRQ
jgi:hypothetical protein